MVEARLQRKGERPVSQRNQWNKLGENDLDRADMNIEINKYP